MSTIGVVVGTYGDKKWLDLANERAVPSVEAQTVYPDAIVVSHAETLQLARNLGAIEAGTDHLIFLDADDELDERYVEAMTQSLAFDPAADLRQPATLCVIDGVEDLSPVLIPERDLRTGNYLVIGTMIRSTIFDSVGGFDDYPILEDWALFLKAWKAGAKITQAPSAIYRVHVTSSSRNTRDPLLHGHYYNKIRRAHA